MRKICAVILILSVCLSSFALLAEADTEWTAKLSISQTSNTSDDSLITLRISIDEITSETGIILAIYTIQFDTECLEYVSHKNGTPENWTFDESSLAAEDWSCLMAVEGETPYFYYSVFNAAATDGVTENGILYTDLTFRVLDASASQTEVTVSEISLTDADGLYQNFSIELPDQTHVIQLNADSTPDVESSDSTESVDTPELSEPTESTESTSSVPEEDTELISTEIMLYDIKDPNGIAVLEFELHFDPSVLEFVKYEFIRPSIWVDDVDYTEDLSQTNNASDGLLYFCALNIDEACGVKEDGILGFRVYFNAPKGTVLDETTLSLSDVCVYNTLTEDVPSGNYRLAIGEHTPESPLSSADILFKGIDSAGGAHDLQFYLNFDPRLSSFVKYEVLYADGSSASLSIEDMSQLDSAAEGSLFFRFVSTDGKVSLSQAGVSGIRVYFVMRNGIQFDPSLLSVTDPVAKNAVGEALDEDGFTILVEGKDPDESFWDTTKVTIMVITAIIVIAAGALVLVIYGRKRKKQ